MQLALQIGVAQKFGQGNRVTQSLRTARPAARDSFGANVALFWSDKPYSAYHYRGIGSPEAAAAEQAAYAAFGGILDCLDRAGEAHHAAGFALSGHGHITGRRKLDTTALFGEGGERVAGGAPGIGEIMLVPGSGAFVFRAMPGADADGTLADWLADQA